jgi:inner membrane protein
MDQFYSSKYTLGAAVSALAGQPVAGAVVGGIAGLLADIDHPSSLAGRRLRPLAVLIESRWGHRESPTHTVMFCAFAGLLWGLVAGLFLGVPLLAISGVLGAVSHLVLDAMTKSGVKPFRVWLPKLPLPGFLPDRARERLERWNAWAAGLEERTGRRHYRGEVVTGQDYREHVIAAFSWLVVTLMVTINR